MLANKHQKLSTAADAVKHRGTAVAKANEARALLKGHKLAGFLSQYVDKAQQLKPDANPAELNQIGQALAIKLYAKSGATDMEMLHFIGAPAPPPTSAQTELEKQLGLPAPPAPAQPDVAAAVPAHVDWEAVDRTGGLSIKQSKLVIEVYDETPDQRRKTLCETEGSYQHAILDFVDNHHSTDDIFGTILKDFYGDFVRLSKEKTFLYGPAGTWEEEYSGHVLAQLFPGPLLDIVDDVCQHLIYIGRDPAEVPLKGLRELRKSMTSDRGRQRLIALLTTRVYDAKFPEKLAKPKSHLLPLKDGYLFDWSRKDTIAAKFTTAPGDGDRTVVNKAEYVRKFLRETKPEDHVSHHLRYLLI